MGELIDSHTHEMLNMDIGTYIRAWTAVCRCEIECVCTDEEILVQAWEQSPGQ